LRFQLDQNQSKTRNCESLRNQSALDSKLKFRLDGQLIPIVNKIKYLGSWLSNSLDVNEHLGEKIIGQAIKISQLEKLGFKYSGLSAQCKAFYYKTYIRPFLFYGLDTFTFKPKDLKRLKTVEGNTIKIALGLPTVLWSTEIFLALKLETTEKQLEKQLLGLVLRLANNAITARLLTCLINAQTLPLTADSILDRVLKVTGPVSSLRELVQKCGICLQLRVNSFEKVTSTDELILFTNELLTTNNKNYLVELLLPFESYTSNEPFQEISGISSSDDE